MRNLTNLLLGLLLLSCAACQLPTPSPAVTSIDIAYDLEDDLYLWANNWHPGGMLLLGCPPDFSVDFDWAVPMLKLRYCATLGSLLVESIVVDNGNCLAWATIPAEPLPDHGFMEWEILLDAGFIECLREENDWINLRFDFVYE